ncbi:MAG: efflux RND transporter periplasmic adaptor subunit [Devosia sp.]|jgi:multidrug efflux system membrane fusion protein|uniref:efflux RND transporter periplasmic adaptor subunit n=1 Tax=Devosia sp. XGJD_8 TaxID=3391187 RepID=UPI001D4EAA43|nr:efflux RND transporter periplasmic adaptor subunit [Alphaproteobacteria bacterium]MBU1563276.1 efflux RND transporter periplasmic adaptor subunit [Alphaproteobacteria bacterium]MBU2303323.1 efflux RND transporter periplasmic adaptor subunit [Alphaproteobacteria bacterium]MBU2368571.1 efflux RND transporter periplasmic adaptor subunit [Alphaproteobacteria bacterium]
MRALYSYGVAFLILVVAGAWFVTGTLVMGGNGPGNGERPLISVIEGEEHGPLATQLEDAGVLAQHSTEHAVDPHLTIAQRNELESGGSTALQSVRTSTYVAQPWSIEVPLRGRTQAKASVGAVAETAGIVDDVHVSKGQKVAVGDLLCTLDQGTRAAAVAQAKAGIEQANAGLAQAQSDFDTNAELRAKGLAAPNTARQLEVALSAAKASVSAAQAALDNAQAELDRTVIHAKVAGVVQDPLAVAGAMLAMGQPCATIVQLDPMVFIGQVPEARIGLAKLGLAANVKTITDQQVEGKVTYISATADAATRSFPVEIELPNPDGSIRDGITATATVTMGTAPAHLLPQSVLTLSDDGVLGVSSVVDGTVKFLPVTIASDTREGVWVLGLPPSVDIITVGQEYVVDGQAVEATNVAAKANSVTAS